MKKFAYVVCFRGDKPTTDPFFRHMFLSATDVDDAYGKGVPLSNRWTAEERAIQIDPSIHPINDCAFELPADASSSILEQIRGLINEQNA